VSQPL